MIENNGIIVGIDEAGRGPLAGDVYAAAVILNKDINIVGLDDSKKISSKKRDFLYDEIRVKAVDFAVGIATVQEIDDLNILQAALLAMKRALEGLTAKFDLIYIDGNIYPFEGIYNGGAVIGGDSIIPQIMAASIIAKVERDRYMQELALEYPQYKFDKHKGYPTKLHKSLIAEYGPSPVHRKYFKGVKEFVKL